MADPIRKRIRLSFGRKIANSITGAFINTTTSDAILYTSDVCNSDILKFTIIHMNHSSRTNDRLSEGLVILSEDFTKLDLSNTKVNLIKLVYSDFINTGYDITQYDSDFISIIPYITLHPIFRSVVKRQLLYPNEYTFHKRLDQIIETLDGTGFIAENDVIKSQKDLLTTQIVDYSSFSYSDILNLIE